MWRSFYKENKAVKGMFYSLLWRLPCPSRGTRPLTFPDVLSRDTGLTVNELGVAMSNRDQWKQLVSQISRALEG